MECTNQDVQSIILLLKHSYFKAAIESNKMKNQLIEKYIKIFLNESTRDESFKELVQILSSQRVKDGDTSEKIRIYAKIYDDILRASRYRNFFHLGNFDQIKNIINRDKTKQNIKDSIDYFKTQMETLPENERNLKGSWCQIRLKNINTNRSITRGQLDDAEVSQNNASRVLRTHQMYFTLQHKDLQFDKSLSPKKLEKAFGEHIKNFADAMLEIQDFAETNNVSESIQITEFKTINVLNFSVEDFLKNHRNSFVKYFTDADNFKIYLSGANRGQTDLLSKKQKIHDKVTQIFESKGFISEKRDRKIFGVDFDIIRADKSLKRTSYGAVTAYVLMNNLFKSESARNKVINGGQKEFWNLVNKAEDWINDSDNSTTIAKLIVNPLNSAYFRD